MKFELERYTKESVMEITPIQHAKVFDIHGFQLIVLMHLEDDNMGLKQIICSKEHGTVEMNVTITTDRPELAQEMFDAYNEESARNSLQLILEAIMEAYSPEESEPVESETVESTETVDTAVDPEVEG